MKKKKEVEEVIKRAIRDELALKPLLPIAHLRSKLHSQGYAQVYGPLDWHYVSKLTKQVRLENLTVLSSEDRSGRLARVKERHRIITEKLTRILEGEPERGDKLVFPTAAERIAAANTIMKWDLALLYAEEQLNEIEKAEMKKPLHLRPIVIEAPLIPSSPQSCKSPCTHADHTHSPYSSSRTQTPLLKT